jgi:hypothetical protein
MRWRKDLAWTRVAPLTGSLFGSSGLGVGAFLGGPLMSGSPVGAPVGPPGAEMRGKVPLDGPSRVVPEVTLLMAGVVRAV